MKMEHYLSHTNYPIWQVIHNGNGPVSLTTDTNGLIKVLPLKTAEEVTAREMERKVRTTLLMALPEDHLVKFHKMADAKEMWEAIKSRFGGNDESKKIAPQLDYNDLEQINDDDMEEMDLKWQDCRVKGNQDSRRRDDGYNGNKTSDNGRRPPYQDDSKALVTIDGEDIDWSGHTLADESDSKPSEYASCESNSNVETSTSMPEPIENASKDDPHGALKDKGIVDSGCSRHITGNKAHLVDYQEFKGGSVAFGGSNGRITGKGKIKTGRLDFEDVYYVEELKDYNLFSVSQFCDKKKNVLFTKTDCLMMSPDFKLLDQNQVLLIISRQHNMYSFNLKNIDPSKDLACLFVKASIDESNKWHRRLAHVNFKNISKLMQGNLVRGLPSKILKNDHTYVVVRKESNTRHLVKPRQ
nr:ribonuclease H-like domain-containing protein [Tanacetum cinerariifolium]